MLTFYFKDYQSIIMQAILMSKQVNHVNSGPEIVHGIWTSLWEVQRIILSLTLLFPVKLTSSFHIIMLHVSYITMQELVTKK